jgi:hypothetical protein
LSSESILNGKENGSLPGKSVLWKQQSLSNFRIFSV